MKPSVFLRQLQKIDSNRLVAIKGVGDVLAKNAAEFASSKRLTLLISKFEQLEKDGKAPTLVFSNQNPGTVLGVVCITGTFDVSRPKIKEILENKGYKVVDTVTKSTTILLAGEDAGSKLAKAKELGIRIEKNYLTL